MQMVKDKITLCREMLPETAGVDRDPAFSEVVGFLEVCTQQCFFLSICDVLRE